MNLKKNYAFDKIILLSAVVWYVLTAYFSTGYYHADEHYQIVEFAAYKEGKVSANGLPWEFKAQIRPATQVIMAYGIFEVAEKVGLNDPYTKAFMLRLITALLAVSVIFSFARHFKKLVLPDYRNLFLLLSFFIWFLPSLNVRFSSEIWAGLIFMQVLVVADKEKRKQNDFVIIGLLSGLAFLFRYQISIAIFGVLLWLLIIKKEKITGLLILVLSGSAVVLAGTLIDYWFYGEFVIVPWNYLNINLLEGKATEFGTSPWYYYFYYVFRFAFFPFGSIIILSFLFFVLKKPRNIIVWAVVPFVFVHMLIGHKELRFLFPLINLVPLMVVYAIQQIRWDKMRRGWRRSILIMGVLLGLINIMALLVASIKPAGRGDMEITRQIWQMKGDENVDLLYYRDSNPYDPWNGIMAGYYLPSGMHFKRIRAPKEIEEVLLKSSDKCLLVLRAKDALDKEMAGSIAELRLCKLGQSIPEWLIPFLKIYGGYHTKGIYYLYAPESLPPDKKGA